MDDKSIVVGFFEEAYNRRNYAYVLSRFREDYAEHSPARSGQARSSRDAVEILRSVHALIPDLRAEVLDAIAEDGRVAVRVRFRMTHTGAFLGVPPTGRTISWEALEIFRVENGLIAESWGYWPAKDMIRMLTE